MIRAFMLAAAAVATISAVTISILQIVLILRASGLPMTLILIAAALLGLRAVLTHRKAATS